MLQKIIFVSFAGLSLSGCFVSQQPLITSQAADWPYQSGTRYASTGGNDVETLSVENGSYVVRKSDGSAQNILLKSIGGGLYIVQSSDSGATDYEYGLLVVNGPTAYEYDFDDACSSNSASYMQSGLVSGVSPGGDCVVASLDNLAAIYRSLYSAGSQPDDTLTLR